MAIVNPRTHVVRTGESISRIAAAYGFRDWKLLYNAPCNADLRRKRPNPDSIRPGDVVLIPPKPEEIARALQDRLAKLRQLRTESADVFDKLSRELDAEHAKVVRVSKNVDMTAEVAKIFVNLAGLVKEGFAAMKLTGKALEKANEEIAKKTVKEAYKPVVEKSAEAWADTLEPGDGLWSGLGKTVLKSWFDMQTPSFWAGVASNLQEGRSWSESVTRKPTDTLTETKQKIAAQRQQTMDALDKRIAQTEQAIRQGHTGPLTLP